MNPEGVSPETRMPNLNLDKKDAQAQAMLVMSWKPVNLPVADIHMPHPERTQVTTNNDAPATEGKSGP